MSIDGWESMSIDRWESMSIDRWMRVDRWDSIDRSIESMSTSMSERRNVGPMGKKRQNDKTTNRQTARSGVPL